MARITMVRHGQAAAGFGEDHDPGLSPLGRQQAAAAADAVESLGPLPILCSPLRRCRETAQALADRWGVTPTVDAAVGAALGEDRVVCFTPDNCSITTLETDGRSLSVVSLGGQAVTEVR